MRPGSRLIWLLVVLAVLAGFSLRTYRLAGQELWGDEAMSTHMAHLPLSQVLAARIDTHPPLFYLLLNLWVRGAGTGLFALRFLPLGASLALVSLAYGLGRRLTGRWAGVAAAWLVAVSPLQVYYAQELRMYSLVGALGAASMLLFARLLDATRPSPAAWLGYGLTTLAAAYAHYQAFPLVAAQGLIALWAWRRDRRRLAVWLATVLGVGLAYLPWALAQARFLGAHSSGQPYALRLARLGAIVREGIEAYLAGLTVPARHAGPAVLLGLALAGAGLASLRRRPRAAGLLVAWLAASLGLWWLADPLMPFFHPRFVLAGAPALALLVGAGLSWVGKRTRAAGLALGPVLVAAPALSAWYTDPAHSKGSYAAALAGMAIWPGDVIILNNAEQQYLFDYYRPAGVPSITLTPDDTYTLERVGQALDRPLSRYSRAWLVTYGDTNVFDPQHNAERYLAGHGFWACYRSDRGFYVNLYVLGLPPPAPPRPLDARFEDGIRLLGYDARVVPVAGGRVLHVPLYWQAQAAPRADYTVFLQLLDAERKVVAQLDGPPAGGTRPTRTWAVPEVVVDARALLLPPTLPPGTYSLWAGLYTWPDLVRLRLDDGSGGDAVLLDRVSLP